MFIASLFTIAKMWKQPERPSVDEWIKKKKNAVYAHNEMLSSFHYEWTWKTLC